MRVSRGFGTIERSSMQQADNITLALAIGAF